MAKKTINKHLPEDTFQRGVEFTKAYIRIFKELPKDSRASTTEELDDLL